MSGPLLHLYLTHPQVTIDPALPVPDWSISALGRQRTEVFARLPALKAFRRIISSRETKAIETAAILGRALGLEPEIRQGMHENDRSATGFLPPPEFEKTADRFFASPGESVRGWERAADAQQRIVGAATAALAENAGLPTVFVGHGGVGTLLFCHCADLAIDRRHDQLPGGGCHFLFSLEPRFVVYAWLPMEIPPELPT